MQRRFTWTLGLIVVGTVQLFSANGADALGEGKILYGQFCQRCHGHELVSTGASTFDLRTFPKGEKDRFVSSVSNGIDSMPPHGDILSSAEINALYEYVTAMQAQPK